MNTEDEEIKKNNDIIEKENIIQSIDNNSNKENKKSKNKALKSIKILLGIAVVLMLLLYLLLIIETTFLGGKTPTIFGKKFFIIVSNSMEPEIKVGDVAVFEKNENIKVGDIIAFKRKNMVIVHRIVDKVDIDNKVMYQTKGDNNNTTDIGFTDIENVEGVLVDKVPFIGKVFIWIYNNLFIIVFICIAIIVGRYFINKKQYTKSKE